MRALRSLACATLISFRPNGFQSVLLGQYTIELVKDSQTLASLRPNILQDFDFLPNKKILHERAGNGRHQIGDITVRYRGHGELAWTAISTAQTRRPVIPISVQADTFASADLSPTLNDSSLHIVRTWAVQDGDLTLSFSLTNIRSKDLEIGSLGVPFVSDSIFTGRTAMDINANCSLIDPYIGLDAGYLQFTRTSGMGPSMVVTPLDLNTSFEAWEFLYEETESDPLQYQSANFEGYYQMMIHSLALLEEKWNTTNPWNPATAALLPSGDTLTIGFRFSMVDDIQGIESQIQALGLPLVKTIPGYVIPNDLAADLYVFSDRTVAEIVTDPSDAFYVTPLGDTHFSLSPKEGIFGRVRLEILYDSGQKQAVFYHISKSGPRAIRLVGQYLDDKHWWRDQSDPFGRAPSFMCLDHSVNGGEPVIQDYLSRAWVSGECHEAGASWYTMAIKQLAQPQAEQVAKLEEFVQKVMWKTIQLPDYSVRQSIFWYDPNLTYYVYDPAYPWKYDGEKYSVSWSKKRALATTRAYGYTYPATTYWALYRVGRTHPRMLTQKSWKWYLSQAYETLVYCFRTTNGTHLQPLWDVGLMGEIAFGEILKDLYREGWTQEAERPRGCMLERASVWMDTAIPYGIELGWDCTGEEGVYYWAQYFGDEATVGKTVPTITGYAPLIAHWGYNGNARRYWDFQFDGKLDRIERQIHHYGSTLNALPLLEYIRTVPANSTQYLTRLAFGGHFAAIYSGDYGPAFAGLVHGSACYVVDDPELGLTAYYGVLNETGPGKPYSVEPRDALRRRLYVQPLDVFIELDAGAIESVELTERS
ncbi:hypothetical protein F5Y15DRAFT_430728 [Xylariaceae sp. FL0016]|nr:hypothetical protein F5Y15DRAFT_430728 [Xylariaceae sp. FL0016]